MSVRRIRPWLRFLSEEHDGRPPPAVKFPAEHGWRVVWFVLREVGEGPYGEHVLHTDVAIGVEAITYWGIEAPRVTPGPPGGMPMSTLGSGVALLPLHGDGAERLLPGARVFRIVSPDDRRVDDELAAECSEWLRAADLGG